MPSISKSGSLFESCSLSLCCDTWEAGSEVSHVGSVGQDTSSDCVSTSSGEGEGDNSNVGAKDDDSYYNPDLTAHTCSPI